MYWNGVTCIILWKISVFIIIIVSFKTNNNISTIGYSKVFFQESNQSILYIKDF